MLRYYPVEWKTDTDNMFNCIPIKDEHDRQIAWGFQDQEADRELRMLRELRENKDALQFPDIFPEYEEVWIWGCNELAVSFAEYLRDLNIPVKTGGMYWELHGFENRDVMDLNKGGGLTVYAEGMPFQYRDLYQTMIRSVSPEFECIDRIYEENVLAGRICDTIGDFELLVKRLRAEKEIVVLGTDSKAQDTYDLLMANGIDICCFALPECAGRRLLGRPVISIEGAMQRYIHPVFINYCDKNGALGEKWTEFFDYRGYRRNSQYFLLRDYTDIPTSNLIHVLRGKSVLLTGDNRLCSLLKDYLYQIEGQEITIRQVAVGKKVEMDQEDIPCLVIPNYCSRSSREFVESRKQELEKCLANMGFRDYTEYFARSKVFVMVDLHLNEGREKYSLPNLMPKGIAIGRIPAWSGNVFLRGVMDGHPEILLIPYSELNENLFYYCVRLAGVASAEVIEEFWKLYEAETDSGDKYFPDRTAFERKLGRMLQLKEKFTSQELFILFHIAYADMWNQSDITDLSGRVIYWEPHFVPRDELPFFAKWLEDSQFPGYTIALRRNNIIRLGSCCKRKVDGMSAPLAQKVMFSDISEWESESVGCQYWAERKWRFEDIKVRPKEMLTDMCIWMGIKWSDSMMQTTNGEKPLVYRGSVDFDLKAVFTKYDDYLSELDRFRAAIASSSYLKTYGYSYENCMEFTRKELQELFLKPFLFDEKKIFGDRTESDNLALYEWIGWKLWLVRKHEVLNDIKPEFDRFDLEQTAQKRMSEYRDEETHKTLAYIKRHDKLVIYGIGNDCEGIMRLLDKNIWGRLVFSDKKASAGKLLYKDKNVIAPDELCVAYKDYNILVTSSLYSREINREFQERGIDPDRVFYNHAEFFPRKRNYRLSPMD